GPAGMRAAARCRRRLTRRSAASRDRRDERAAPRRVFLSDDLTGARASPCGCCRAACDTDAAPPWARQSSRTYRAAGTRRVQRAPSELARRRQQRGRIRPLGGVAGEPMPQRVVFAPIAAREVVALGITAVAGPLHRRLY